MEEKDVKITKIEETHMLNMEQAREIEGYYISNNKTTSMQEAFRKIPIFQLELRMTYKFMHKNAKNAQKESILVMSTKDFDGRCVGGLEFGESISRKTS